ncbi:MAG: hypothetical protein QNJ97_10785 [Myxococcota bacterium]|nr:hypothetical protein [Myxococcota bacterium]
MKPFFSIFIIILLFSSCNVDGCGKFDSQYSLPSCSEIVTTADFQEACGIVLDFAILDSYEKKEDFRCRRVARPADNKRHYFRFTAVRQDGDDEAITLNQTVKDGLRSIEAHFQIQGIDVVINESSLDDEPLICSYEEHQAIAKRIRNRIHRGT